MKFDRQLRPATETSWVVSYGCKTIPRWRTAAILKIDICHVWKTFSSEIMKNHPLSMKFCTQQQILNWMNVTWSKNEKKLHWTDSEFDRTYFLWYVMMTSKYMTWWHVTFCIHAIVLAGIEAISTHSLTHCCAWPARAIATSTTSDSAPMIRSHIHGKKIYSSANHVGLRLIIGFFRRLHAFSRWLADS